MQVHIHHHHHLSPETERALARMVNAAAEALHHRIREGIAKMTKSLQELIDQGHATLAVIQQNTSLEQSIIHLVQSNADTIRDLQAKLAAAGTDPEKLEELSGVMAQLADAASAEATATAAAVTANTPQPSPVADAPAAAAPADAPAEHVNPAAAQAVPPAAPST